VIVILVKGCNGKNVATTQKPAETTKPVETTEPQKQLTGFSEATCDEQSAIGFRKCSKLENNDVQFTLLHQGSAQLIGFQYYLYDANGVKIGEDSQMMTVEGGAEAVLTLPVSGTSGTAKVEIRPLMNVGGADSICKNQHVIQFVDRC
ncbi:MAG: hypothetical protein NT001_03860, partial [Candidatus Woesearchaeota archaeon]|nr:hypothetical protein [Candidatus Woesearchaeota archaeon]